MICEWCSAPATGTALGWYTIMQMRVNSCGAPDCGTEFIAASHDARQGGDRG